MKHQSNPLWGIRDMSNSNYSLTDLINTLAPILSRIEGKINRLLDLTAGSERDNRARASSEPAKSNIRTYAFVITEEGKKEITNAQYSELLDHEADYDMFIDGCSMQASKKANKTDEPIKDFLNPTGFALLKEIIESPNGISIAHANARIPEHLSRNHPHKYFQSARKKVDFQIKRNNWKYFRRISGKEEHTIFRFNPPEKYCLIVPANWDKPAE